MNTNFVKYQKSLLKKREELDSTQDGIFSILSSELTYSPTIADEKPNVNDPMLSKKDTQTLMDKGDLDILQMEDLDTQYLDDLQNIVVDDIQGLDINEMSINDLIGDIEIDL